MCEWETDLELRWPKLGFQGLLPSLCLPMLTKRLVMERGMFRQLRLRSLKLRFYCPASNTPLSIFLWRQVDCISQADLQLNVPLPQPPECLHRQLPSSFPLDSSSVGTPGPLQKCLLICCIDVSCSDTKLLCAHVLNCVLSA